jgi:nicotinamidase-related amidase
MANRVQKPRRRAVKYHPGDALIIIDTINDLEFPGGEKVLPWVLKMTPRLVAIRGKARRNGMPVIYVNDNFGR